VYLKKSWVGERNSSSKKKGHTRGGLFGTSLPGKKTKLGAKMYRLEEKLTEGNYGRNITP